MRWPIKSLIKQNIPNTKKDEILVSFAFSILFDKINQIGE